ncbi:hypothetical protein FRC15_005929, partial [Serendipita sp. 397]
MDVKVTFINSIEPSDFTRLSLPFIYVSVTATSNDGARHSVQIYSDLSGEWLSADSGKPMTWSTTKSNSLILHTFSLAAQTQFQATDNRVEYGLGYHAMIPSDGVTYQSGQDTVLRGGFRTGGALNNTADTNFRDIEQQWPCFAFAKNLGNITDSSTAPVVFAVGLSRDPAISYTAGGTQQSRSLFYRTQFSTDSDAISFFLNDYELAVSSANNFDSKLSTAASQISGTYSDLAGLAARQVASHIEVTVSTGSDGKLNASDVMVFMGNDGVNRMEEIYASAPFWIYINPDILRLMLLPNIRWQQLSSTNTGYVADDLGDTYPQASGPGSSLLRPKALESTSNMMITTAALIKATGNAAIVSENANLYKTWADYLKSNTLIPGQQTTSDGVMVGAPSNDTNLALKGIIALKAYADILSTLGQDGSAYSDTARSYASQWQSMAEANAGFAASYGDSGSWSSCYNLFADKWLKTGLFPESVYSKMSELYASNINKFGLPLGSRTTLTSPHWMIFAAGVTSDITTRDSIIKAAQDYIQNGKDDLPWPSIYDSIGGNATVAGVYNRPAIGGVYALLVQDLGTTVSTGNPNSGGSNGSNSRVIVQSTNLIVIYIFS